MRKVVFGTIHIGRWHCLDRWFSHLEKLRMDFKKMKAYCVLNTKDSEFKTEFIDRMTKFNWEDLIAEETFFRPIDHYQSKGCNAQKQYNIAENFKLIYKFAEKEKRDLFIIEDDVLVPPEAFERLQELAYQSDDILAAAATIKWWSKIAKHLIDKKVSWRWEIKRIFPEEDIETQAVAVFNEDLTEGTHFVGATPTGCIYIKHELLKSGYEPKPMIIENGHWGQDIWLGYYINNVLKKKLVVDLDLNCGHVVNYGKKQVILWNNGKPERIKTKLTRRRR